MKPAAQGEREGFDGDLESEEWFCPKDRAAGKHGARASKSLLVTKDHRRVLIDGSLMDSRAKLKPVHALHLYREKITSSGVPGGWAQSHRAVVG